MILIEGIQAALSIVLTPAIIARIFEFSTIGSCPSMTTYPILAWNHPVLETEPWEFAVESVASSSSCKFVLEYLVTLIELQTFTSANGSQPLRFSLKHDTSDSIPHPQIVGDFLQQLALLTISTRLSDLYLSGLPPAYVDSYLTTSPAVNFTTLESLSLLDMDRDDSSDTIMAFRVTPQLSSLHLHVPTFPSLDSFPWRQLKFLKLHISNSLIEYAELLRLLTNLETCVLDLRIDDDSVIPRPTNTTTYSNLRLLDLSIYDDRDQDDDHNIPGLWDLKIFPSLETLIHTSPKLYMSTPYPSKTLILALYDFDPQSLLYQSESQAHYLSHLPPTLERLAIEFSNQGELGDSVFAGDRKQVQPIVEALSNLGRLSELALAVYVGRRGSTLVAEGVVDVILGWGRALRSRAGYEDSAPADEMVLQREQEHTLTLFGIGDDGSVEKFFEDVDKLYRKEEDGSIGIERGLVFNRRKLGVWRINMGKEMGWVMM